MIDTEKFSLKELRARKKVNQTEVAKAIGVSLSTYFSWEKDMNGMPVKKLISLAEYFNVDIKNLI